MYKDALNVVKKLKDNKFEAFFVGGCVRDLQMNVNPKDIDITTNALPDDVHNIFKKYIDTGLKHGTVTVVEGSNFFEVTTYRTESEYDDGRHPNEVTFVTSVEEDLARRDFTMNAIAFDPTTETFVDPFNGKSDIEAKIVRCVGIAKNRFMEDPLRVLRAMRFAIKYGFTIEDNTKIAMHDAEVLEKLDKCISKERITEELRKMLTCGKPIHDMFMEFNDIISIIIPEIKDCVNAPHNSFWHKHDIYDHILHVVDDCKTTKFEIKLAALLHDIGKPVSRIYDAERKCDHFYGHPAVSHKMAITVFENDLRVANDERDLVLKLILHHDESINASKHSMRKMIATFGMEFIKDWIILKEADLFDHKAPEGEEYKYENVVERFITFKNTIDDVAASMTAFKKSDLAVNGHDIMEILNLKPGRIIGTIIDYLFKEVIENDVPNDKNVLIEMIKTTEF